MKRFVICLLALVLLLSTGALPVSAAGKLSVVQEAFYVLPYLDYHAGYVYAEVRNIGDKPVEFNGGLLELYDPEGNSIEAENYLRCYPDFLDAGETGYMYMQQSVKEATDKSFIDDYLLTITGKGAKENPVIRMQTADAKLVTEDSAYWSRSYFYADVTNTSADIAYEFYVVFALKDAEGKILYADSCNPSYVGLKPDNTVQIRLSVDSDLIEYFAANNITPSTVEAIAYVKQD